MLTFRGLTVSFQKPDGEALHALGPVHLGIERGQFVCIVGPSGCGKSTLIKVVAGLQPATQGAVVLGETPIRSPSPRVGLMFQAANLMPWRTVRDNVALPLELAGIKREQRAAAAEEMLQTLGLSEFAEVYPGGLSGGMAQRVALGRVLVQQPEVLLLDEPFGALDAMTREQISLDLLAQWRRTRQTVLMVTHDINDAVLMSDRVIVLSRRPGRVVADITIDLPRPRQPAMMFTPEFGGFAQAIREAITLA
ncbi:MAG: ABC transporter ATP-binding protein [Anaerolineae bacterium]|nr:ABC transporter ATP-binding protein [Anaerolineae bacterium]